MTIPEALRKELVTLKPDGGKAPLLTARPHSHLTLTLPHAKAKTNTCLDALHKARRPQARTGSRMKLRRKWSNGQRLDDRAGSLLGQSPG